MTETTKQLQPIFGEQEVPPKEKFDPKDDGITHINLYSRAKTHLGQKLSNWAKTPFTHPKYGRFQSMEGFYYFIRSGALDTTLPILFGYQAKMYGQKLPRVTTQDFEKIMIDALRYKVSCNPDLRQQLLESSLPFAHYYVYGEGENVRAIHKPEHDWLVHGYEAIRERLKAKEQENHD